MFISLNPHPVWVPVIRSGPRCKQTNIRITNIRHSRVSHKGSEEIILFNYYVKL